MERVEVCRAIIEREYEVFVAKLDGMRGTELIEIGHEIHAYSTLHQLLLDEHLGEDTDGVITDRVLQYIETQESPLASIVRKWSYSDYATDYHRFRDFLYFDLN